MNFFLQIFRALFALIDGLVIWAIKLLYTLLIQIASTDVFGNFIYEMLGRIYVFLGIFMLFKLSMSVISYIINPDAMTDKSKGFSKLITNVIISLILLVTVPSIFSEAYRLQGTILNTNAIYQIVTGKKIEGNVGDNSSDVITNAEAISSEIAAGVFSNFIYAHNDEDRRPFTGKGTDRCGANDPECMVSLDTVNKSGSGPNGFANEYKFLLSTICGAVVAYFFLIFCLDAAVRAIKLGVLQIIAPIPILSMVDPKDGNKKLTKWASECGKEYAGLFIRLAGVFFAVAVINQMLDQDLYYYNSNTIVNNSFVKLFIIIGALMFAKQLPDFIQNIFGIKLSGDGFSLKKRLGSMPGMGLAKMAGAGALGFAGGMAANAWASRGNWKGQGLKNGFKNVGSILGGGFSAGARGLVSKEKNMFKAAGGGIKGAVDKRNLRDVRQANHDSGIPGVVRRTGVAIDNWAGVESGASKFDKQLAAYDAFLKEQSGLDSYIEGEIMKGKGSPVTKFTWTDVKGRTLTSTGNVNVLKKQVESLTASGASAIDIQNAENAYNAALKQAKIDYVDSGTDSAVKNMISEMNYIRESNSSYAGFDTMPEITSGSDWDSAKGTIKAAKSKTKVSSEYRQAQINKKNDAKR